MSDIAIRFDGLLLIASLAIAMVLYFLIALGAAVLRLTSKYERRRLQRAVRIASLCGVLDLVVLAMAAAYMNYWGPPASGPDWLDWLAIPVLALFSLGCSIILQSRPSPRWSLDDARTAAQPESLSVG
ncbi:amino acid transporter [Sphingomonas sp. F9_3S_D5_B_2]